MDSGERQVNMHTFERPPVPVGIHANRHARTCSQRRQQQLVWIWTDVPAARRDRFISAEEMRADRDVLRVPQLPSFDNDTSAHDSLQASTHGSFLMHPKTLAQSPLEDFAGPILR